MYLHAQQLINDIEVDEPDAAAANALQEGLGGQSGEMRTMMQYLFHSISTPHLPPTGRITGIPARSLRSRRPDGAQGATPLSIALDTSNIEHYLICPQGLIEPSASMRGPP